MKLIDTHCHIQFKDYKLDPEAVWASAKDAGVYKIFVVGCDLESSQRAVDFANSHEDVYAIVGVHPHEAKPFLQDKLGKTRLEGLLNDKNNKIIGIGEFGLDYFYNHSPKSDQIELAKYHLSLADRYDLPIMLHIRDAFEDFWAIFDAFKPKTAFRGVVHCFTAGSQELEQALDRGLHVALNGIVTFTKDQDQLEVAKSIPLDRLLLETDAPFLTPVPFRGKICKPEHTALTAEFLAKLRGEPIGVVASATTKNAINLFNLKNQR